MLTIIHPCQYASDSHLHIHPVVPALVAPLTLKGPELDRGLGMSQMKAALLSSQPSLCGGKEEDIKFQNQFFFKWLWHVLERRQTWQGLTGDLA